MLPSEGPLSNADGSHLMKIMFLKGINWGKNRRKPCFFSFQIVKKGGIWLMFNVKNTPTVFKSRLKSRKHVFWAYIRGESLRKVKTKSPF